MLVFEISEMKQIEKIETKLKAEGMQCRSIHLWSRNFFIASPDLTYKDELIDLLSMLGGRVVLDTNSESPLSSREIKAEFSNFSIGNGIVLSEKSTLFIGGPCAVESRGQMDETAAKLSSLGVRALRAGAFKPRTSIYSFQGLELDGLKILRECGDRYKMIVVTEAKDSSHIELVAEFSDVIQIGTKSMYNFDLLRKAAEFGKPVMLKRGFMTTIKEYMQALDVILATGNERVIMCERGLRTFETQTRFTLDLAGAAVLKLSSHLPLVIDPSHTTGRRDIVAALSQSSVALGIEGLLVEIHPNPETALSDREQAFPLKDVPTLLRTVKKIARAVNREII
jgi:3-deoxy-7-phosphoheptulonate synthase